MENEESGKPKKKLSEKELNVMTRRLSDAMDNYPEFKEMVIELITYKIWSGNLAEESFLDNSATQNNLLKKFNPILEIVYDEPDGSRNAFIENLDKLEKKLEVLPANSMVNLSTHKYYIPNKQNKRTTLFQVLKNVIGFKVIMILAALSLITLLNYWLSSLVAIGPDHWKNFLKYVFLAFIPFFIIALISLKLKRNLLLYSYLFVLMLISSLLYGEYLSYEMNNHVNDINIFQDQGILLGTTLAYLLFLRKDIT